ncbi:DNA cytosine methyltransferase [Idiomarina seosinensis]|uniref:DNA cytosine methyltransferase n=1 Tax=Idiomarina seosinensis TaxID=281739 RepID=UPI00384FFBE9
MKVLVACEFSGVVRDAFLDRGHDAVSCDLLQTESPGPHVVGDCFDAISSQRWDLIIMHPPCTALAVSGNRWYGKGCEKHDERLKAIDWTVGLFGLAKRQSVRVCMENPVGVLPIKPTQYVQPWQFGHGETKKTGLWLHNLPPLKPTNIVDGREQKIWKMPPSADRWKQRSVTFKGIAEAMAEQWS